MWVVKLWMATPVCNVSGEAVARKPWEVNPACDLGDEAVYGDPCV